MQELKSLEEIKPAKKSNKNILPFYITKIIIIIVMSKTIFM